MIHPLTVLLGLLGGVSNVVLAASVCKDDAHLGDSGPGTLTRAEAVVCQIAESLTCHGSPLHVGHLLHSILQVFLVVVAAQGELLQDGDGNMLINKRRKEVLSDPECLMLTRTCLTELEYCTSPT